MIDFNTTNNFYLENATDIIEWINKVITLENKFLGEVNYIFCDDKYLHKINVDFLDHDTYTDIISFDYTSGNFISGDIYISTDRVEENSKSFNTSFKDELARVLIHGILHYCGYKDKTKEEAALMRKMEDKYLSIRS